MNRLFTAVLSAVVASCTFSPFAYGQAATAAKQTAIFTSKTYVAPNTKEQHFEDNITLGAGQENLPLLLVVNNGANGKVPFNWFRITINGFLIASEKDLNGKRQGSIDVSGRLQGGSSQVLIDAAGEPGATLSWSVLTSPISLQSVEPTTVMQGQTIVLNGINFSPNEDQDKVFVQGKPATVLSASATSITARIPADTPAGTNSVQVVVNGTETRALPINVGAKPIPVLHSMNYWMAPPGAILTIRGSNFGAKASDNQVFFKSVPGQVVNASPTRLQVIIPNWAYGPSELNIPVFVVANGVRSGNYLPFDIGPQYQGAIPPMPGDSSSQASSQASSEGGWPLDASSEASTENSSQAGSEQGSEASFQAGSQAGSEAPGPLIYP